MSDGVKQAVAYAATLNTQFDQSKALPLIIVIAKTVKNPRGVARLQS